MIKKLLISTGLAVCLIFTCAAQTNYSAVITDHGEPVLGVWLAIESSTNAAVTGSEISLWCLIKNSSTNDVGIPVSNPMALFEVILTNRSGEIFVINDPTTVPIFMNHIVTLGAGEIREITIPASHPHFCSFCFAFFQSEVKR